MYNTKKLLAVALLGILMTSCGRPHMSMQSYKYYENAKKKPVVAMLPIVCKVDYTLPWDLSEELSSEIQRRLINQSVVYLNTVEMPESLRTKLDAEDSIALTKEDYAQLSGKNDFVVLIELIDHSDAPYHKNHLVREDSNQVLDRMLSVKVRLNVIDIRTDDAKIVLREILPFEQQIPYEAGLVDYERVVWGSDAYPATPYGKTHARLEKDVSRQIEKYISIAH